MVTSALLDRGIATGAQPYILLAQPSVWPITVDLVKSWARISTTADDDLILMLIKAVTLSVEKFTKRDLITKPYRTYRDNFGDIGENPSYQRFPAQQFGHLNTPISLRRSKLQVITSIKYWLNGVEETVDSNIYYKVHKDAFGAIALVEGADWPSNDNRQQGITIDFTAGYGDSADDIPDDLKQAMLMHVTAAYQNRGDCDSGSGGKDGCSCEMAPAGAGAIYTQYRIIDFVA